MINNNKNIFQKRAHNEVVNKTKVYKPIIQYRAFFCYLMLQYLEKFIFIFKCHYLRDRVVFVKSNDFGLAKMVERLAHWPRTLLT